MPTLVPGLLFAKHASLLSLAQSTDAPSDDNSRHIALLGALVLLFAALTLLRRAFKPLHVVRDVFLPVLAAALGTLLVFAALVLLIAATVPLPV